jgi:hypothetical protein
LNKCRKSDSAAFAQRGDSVSDDSNLALCLSSCTGTGHLTTSNIADDAVHHRIAQRRNSSSSSSSSSSTCYMTALLATITIIVIISVVIIIISSSSVRDIVQKV